MEGVIQIAFYTIIVAGRNDQVTALITYHRRAEIIYNRVINRASMSRRAASFMGILALTDLGDAHIHILPLNQYQVALLRELHCDGTP